jgi:hypothetical protein
VHCGPEPQVRAVNEIAIALIFAGGLSLILGRGPGFLLVAPAVVVIRPMSSYFAWSVLFPSARHRLGR